jgi:glucan endo-1,3-beta-D-glucosidase
MISMSLAEVNPLFIGFNIGANNEDGSCRSTQDWIDIFNKLKTLPQGIDSVRVYASSDCNTLANVVPVSLYSGIKILVGVWVTDDGHFSREKDALYNAIQQYGSSWIAAISVGSEDLYRAQHQQTNEIDPGTLATRIYDVRGMVRSQGVNAAVGHVDTW